MIQFTISLRASERDALRKLANHERRNVKAQAAVIIREALIERGLIPTDTSPDQLVKNDFQEVQA